MRLFVALEIPEETREALGALIARLRVKCGSAKWVRPEAMHVTLKFIGHTGDENLGPIRDALAAIRETQQGEMRFRGLGFFPNARRPRVLWCGVEASPNVGPLAAAIDHALTPLGIPSETRAFTPHLTLARFNSHDLHQRGKQPAGLAEIVGEVRESAAKEFGTLRAEEFYLFESKLRPSGAEYTRLETFRFAKAAI
jgi:2'-5' RNA ligase